ncbi:MAG: hypothetical protein ACRDKS_17315 [Actinomycetota bacterium]
MFEDLPAVPSGLQVTQTLESIYEDQLSQQHEQGGTPSRQPGAIRLRSLWGARFRAGVAEMALAMRAASWAVGLPANPQNFVVVWTAEDVREYVAQATRPPSGPGLPSPIPGEPQVPAVGSIKFQGPCSPAGQARGIVALWLAGRSTPGAGNTLRAWLADQPYGLRIYETFDGNPVADLGNPSFYPNEWPFAQSSNVEWGIVEAHYAGQLLERPAAEVGDLIRQHWLALTDPGTTTAEAVRILDLERLPTLEEQLREAGIDRAEFIKRMTLNGESEKAEATLDEGLESALYRQDLVAACP